MKSTFNEIETEQRELDTDHFAGDLAVPGSTSKFWFPRNKKLNISLHFNSKNKKKTNPAPLQEAIPFVLLSAQPNWMVPEMQ